MRIRIAVLTVGLVLGGAVPLAAQSWESPSFFSPRPGEDIGLYLVRPDDGGDIGIAGIWRQSGNINLGVRAGLAGDMIHVGGEYYNELHAPGPQSPLLMSWVLGLGASFDDDVTWLRVPLGVSAGLSLDAGGMTVLPYVHPRVTLDFVTVGRGDAEQSDTEFNLPVDIGADVAIGTSLVARVGATLNDGGTTFGAGLAWRMSRRLIVR